MPIAQGGSHCTSQAQAILQGGLDRTNLSLRTRVEALGHPSFCRSHDVSRLYKHFQLIQESRVMQKYELMQWCLPCKSPGIDKTLDGSFFDKVEGRLIRIQTSYQTLFIEAHLGRAVRGPSHRAPRFLNIRLVKLPCFVLRSVLADIQDLLHVMRDIDAGTGHFPLKVRR